MHVTDWFTKACLLAIAVFLGFLALHSVLDTPRTVFADSARFDHVYVISPVIAYKGAQGLLVMDKRNGNVWFLPKVNDAYQDPVFVVRAPFEKLDQAPQ